MTNKKAANVKSPLEKEDKEPEVTPALPRREYSIIVWGATGFTGQLVCHHIANDYAGHFKWAMAGRSREKLEELRSQLEKVDPKCGHIPILTADLNDQKSLDKLVKQADVVISTAGPFWNIGMPMVDASIRTNTHYCDIAGEVHWMRRTTRTLHELAKARNVKIVHSCGFDSIPSDLGVFMLSRHMKAKLDRPCSRVDLLVNEAKGGFSGGSIQSMIAHFSAEDDEIAACQDPYCLVPSPPSAPAPADVKDIKVDDKSVPDRAGRAAPSPDQRGPRFNNRVNKWTYPFQFAPNNTRVVHRSNALWEPNSYGPSFQYSEAHEAEGPVDAILGTMGHTFVHLVTTVPLLRSLVAPLLPEPGDGPPEAYRKKSHWRFTLYGWTQEEGRTKPRRCEAVVRGKRDPGYWETSRMVLESALCLALQGPELLDAGYLQGGVLTPATAMGSVLIERLNKAGITFEITKTGLEKAPTPLDALKPASKAPSNVIGGAISSVEAADAPTAGPPSSKTVSHARLSASVSPVGRRGAADAASHSIRGAAEPCTSTRFRCVDGRALGVRAGGFASAWGPAVGAAAPRRDQVDAFGVSLRHVHPLLVRPLHNVGAWAQQGLGKVAHAHGHVQRAVGGCVGLAHSELSRSCTHVMHSVARAQRHVQCRAVAVSDAAPLALEPHGGATQPSLHALT